MYLLAKRLKKKDYLVIRMNFEGIGDIVFKDEGNLNQGYLISFNFNKNKDYKQERVKESEKDIFAIWV